MMERQNCLKSWLEFYKVTPLPHLFVIVLDFALRMAMGKDEELGFQLTQKQSRRIGRGPEAVTDFDFADDI